MQMTGYYNFVSYSVIVLARTQPKLVLEWDPRPGKARAVRHPGECAIALGREQSQLVSVCCNTWPRKTVTLNDYAC